MNKKDDEEEVIPGLLLSDEDERKENIPFFLGSFPAWVHE
jgi:hypothetical protein